MKHETDWIDVSLAALIGMGLGCLLGLGAGEYKISSKPPAAIKSEIIPADGLHINSNMQNGIEICMLYQDHAKAWHVVNIGRPCILHLPPSNPDVVMEFLD